MLGRKLMLGCKLDAGLELPAVWLESKRQIVNFRRRAGSRLRRKDQTDREYELHTYSRIGRISTFPEPGFFRAVG